MPKLEISIEDLASHLNDLVDDARMLELVEEMKTNYPSAFDELCCWFVDVED